MTRKELIAYDKWLTRRKWGTGEIISPERAADIYLAEHSLPPAEGAEAIVKKYEDEYDFKFHWVQRDRVIRMMREFAAQPQPKLDPKKVQWSGYGELGNISQKPLQPTAEGAEEILQKYMDMSMIICPLHVVPRTVALDAMHEFATLHAQRIAEKMVSERLREELGLYNDWLNGAAGKYLTSPYIDEYLTSEYYLKTRESHD